ncbi:carboxylesterase family domain-containing protein [Trichoderma breve]|uniref:Carboxylic ester hydrolase n=1 Tax=Trichoderma breve TaxID=2034170 RepID=A0A9W9EFD3_9HYPO|nr:carboxylesterase family domain-containing protein [Trichoderma breve]KAJ4865659.1 carboxylesterase family domain-containing protein [Trichoderma breve]
MIKSLLLVSILGSCALGAPSHSTSNNPVVDLGYAKYRGVRNATYGLDYYFGIRYAVPPEGDLRWRAPQDIESHGPQCVQGPTAWANGTDLTSEDCLLLNVLKPVSPKSKSLPVLVYIHGGGYVTGNSISSDGSDFTKYAQGNVIWVSIQYRLGAYGFLNPKEFDGQEGVKNAGLLDQRLALEWVQRHISAFGGDPSKVTIWGGSAGGGSVVNQMIYKGGEKKPPYRGVIAEFPWLQPYHDDTFLQKQYQNFLNDAKCGNVACLRKLSPSALETAINKSYYTGYDAGIYSYGDMYYGPSVDGDFVRDLPSVEFNKGHFARVPFMTNHDSFEGILFTNFSTTSFDENKAQWQKTWHSPTPKFWESLSQLYPLSSFGAKYYEQPFFRSLIFPLIGVLAPLSAPGRDPSLWQTQQINGDANINCPTYYFAEAAQRYGVPAYKSIFDAGVYVHSAADFPIFNVEIFTVDSSVATAVKDYFLSFIIRGDPNTFPSVSHQTRTHWPQYGQKNYAILNVSDTNIAAQRDPDASERCDFWHSQSAIVRN